MAMPSGFQANSDRRRSTIIIMRATLHDRAPNTYYGQWSGEKPLFAGLESPAIARNELVGSAGFVPFNVPERGFPRESLAAALEICVSTKKEKNCAPGGVARFQRRLRAHRFCLKQRGSRA
jgi:hypothetical protein